MNRLIFSVLVLGLSTWLMAQAAAKEPKASFNREAQTLLDQANHARKGDKFDEAIEFVRKAAQAGASQDDLIDKLESISETAINSAAELSQHLKDVSLKAGETAVELAPGSSRAHDMLGTTFSYIFNDQKKAVREFQAAISLDKKNENAWHHLLGSLRMDRRFEERIKVTEDFENLNDRKDSTHFGLLADSECGLERYEDAIAHFKKALELAKNDVDRKLVQANFDVCLIRRKK
jgi:tetratricopeptide (TPR) repeat protein